MKNTMKLASSVVLGLIISACSSTQDNTKQANQNTNQVTTNKDSIESLEQQLAQFQEMKPSLERLVLVETELKALISEIESMAQQQKSIVTPASAPIALPTSEKKTVALPMQKKAPITKKPYNDYALQIFTTDNRSSLEKSWLRWSKKHSSVLVNRSKIYQKTEINGINYYRIKLTNFTTKQEALESCLIIKEHGGDCFLTNNIGDSF